MRILHTNFQADYGGAERHVLLLARGQRALGHEAYLLCRPDGRLARESAEALGPSAVLPTGARGQGDPRGLLAILRAVRRIAPDVVHLHTPHEYLAGAIAARFARGGSGPRFVLTRHMLRPVRPLMLRVYRKGVDAIVCPSEAVRAGLQRAGVPASKLFLVPGSIDLSEWATPAARARRAAIRAEWRVGPGEIAVGVVGRLVEGKGQEVLLEAAARLGRSARIRFVVVGDGPARGRLARLARGRPEVVLAGFRRDVPAVLAALDVVALTSTVTEAMPLALLEAMAAARPVVATRVEGGVRELVEDGATGLLVPPGDPVALSGAILRLARDEGLRARLGAEARAVAEARFSMLGMAEATATAYGAAVAQGAARRSAAEPATGGPHP